MGAHESWNANAVANARQDIIQEETVKGGWSAAGGCRGSRLKADVVCTGRAGTGEWKRATGRDWLFEAILEKAGCGIQVRAAVYSVDESVP